MPKVESDIQTEIIEYLRGRRDVYLYNAGGGASSAKGTSDLLLCFRGRFVAVELKRQDGSYGLTTPQAIRQKQVRNAGGVAEVVRSVAEMHELLEAIVHGQPQV